MGELKKACKRGIVETGIGDVEMNDEVCATDNDDETDDKYEESGDDPEAFPALAILSLTSW